MVVAPDDGGREVGFGGFGAPDGGFEGWEQWAGDIRMRSTGSLVADRQGPATTYSMLNLQDRATMMVGPGTTVYGGMIVGENSRAGDMDVNICKEKKLTNVRAASADDTAPQGAVRGDGGPPGGPRCRSRGRRGRHLSDRHPCLRGRRDGGGAQAPS